MTTLLIHKLGDNNILTVFTHLRLSIYVLILNCEALFGVKSRMEHIKIHFPLFITIFYLIL